MISESKRAISGLAALLILVFHCWVSVFSYSSDLGSIERFLVTTAYVGVDMFFFISAYSLARRPVAMGFRAYADFVGSRALRILPYFFIALLAGQFIWFLPAIMIMYMLFPPLYRFCERKQGIAIAAVVAGWVLVVYILLGIVKVPWDLGIALFRVPVIIAGAFAGRVSVRGLTRFDEERRDRAGITPNRGSADNARAASLSESDGLFDEEYYEYSELTNVMNYNSMKLIVGIALVALGTLLLNQFGYLNKLNTPYKGMFYIMAMPTAIGLVLLLAYFSGIRKMRILEFIGGFTLELYFVQMVLGGWLINKAWGLTHSRLLTNVIVFAVLLALAWLLKRCTEKIEV